MINGNDIPRVFLSHSCDQHPFVDLLAKQINELGNIIRVDPFAPAERTASRVDQEIKSATHFIQFYTKSCMTSRWVELESTFAWIAYKENSLGFIPIQIDNGPIWPPSKAIMHISWNTSCELSILAQEVNRVIKNSHPSSRLVSHQQISYKLKEIGRELERTAIRHQDPSCLNQADHVYALGQRMDFSNYDAWGNQANTVFKLGEQQRATSLITTALLINPNSSRLKDLYKKITHRDPRAVIEKYNLDSLQ